MARTKVKMSKSGARAFLRSDSVSRALRPHAERVAAQARSAAPVDTGAYRDSIRTVTDTTDRAVVRVVAGVPYARIVEARHGTLARALGAAGG